MIPALVSLSGAPWMVLPTGVHRATLEEIEAAFATNAHRRSLFAGFVAAAHSFASAGCPLIYLDGSYVTEKPMPGDYDACWEPGGVNPTKLDPVLVGPRPAQKAKFKGEFFPVVRDTTGYSFIDFFQKEKLSGGQKGILSVQLSISIFATRSTK